jgi:hypothetical protein
MSWELQEFTKWKGENVLSLPAWSVGAFYSREAAG